MNVRRRGLAGLLTVALLAPGLAACATDDATGPGGAGETSAPADPKQALLAATEEIDKGNFKFTLTGDGITGDGSMHAPSRSARIGLKAGADEFSMEFDVIYIEPETWIKIDLDGVDGVPGLEGLKSGKYQHMDTSRIAGNDDLTVDFDDVDPAGSAILAKAVVDVREVEGGYSGTIDLTKATDAGLTDEETITALGTAAATVPFTAKVDGQSRLVELVLQVPGGGEIEAHELKVTYEYDAASAVEAPPASEVVEATDETYEMLQ